MKRSVSLKEFSTTPTVSCMLRKDGNNVASDSTPPPAPAVKTNVTNEPKQPVKHEEMFDMD